MRGAILAVYAVLAVIGDATAAEPPAKPNVIFVLSDDLAQGDVGCYGQKFINTPHRDTMAKEGMRFTQAYCGTSVCAPSRTSLMIGKHMGHSPIRASGRQVYDLAKDVGQSTDLTAKYPERVAEMKRAWERWDGRNVAPLWHGTPLEDPTAPAK